MNVRSISKNFDHLLAILCTINITPDVIVLPECWVSKCSTIPPLEGYITHSRQCNRSQNDGVVIYIKSHLEHSVEEPHTNDLNCLIAKLRRLI